MPGCEGRIHTHKSNGKTQLVRQHPSNEFALIQPPKLEINKT